MQLRNFFVFLGNTRLFPKNSSKKILKAEETNIDSSLDLIFDLIKERITNQQERFNGIDAKANFAVGAATTLVSAGLVLQSLLLPHSYAACSTFIPQFLHALPLPLKRAIPLLPLLTTYLAVTIIALNSYGPQKIQRVPVPDNLVVYYLYQTSNETKKRLLREMINAFNDNEKLILRKANSVTLAFIVLMIESITLVLLLLFEAIC